MIERQMPSPFETIERIKQRSASAIVSWSAMASQPLREHLLETLVKRGDPDSLVSELVVECAHPWETATETFEALKGNFLEAELVEALSGAGLPMPDDRERYILRPDMKPFRHQLEAWRRLLSSSPQSVLVTSGTGSGKTECFLIPILNQLVRASNAGLPHMSGVRAIILYPLNALINSQRERLSDWTAPFGGKIRFCLYNGETPNQVKKFDRDKTPEQVIDRETLRRDPPPILVTNITMLEYMLIRSEDNSILSASQGKLQYIVLDEAHSYVGSQAAELALLLRRVMQAFGVSSKDVRFVATSATLGKEGDPNTLSALRKFLSEVSGTPRDHVHVVEGRRQEPALPPEQIELGLPELSELASLGSDGRYLRLGAAPRFRKALKQLGTGPATVAQWADVLGRSINETEKLLEFAAKARSGKDQLLPLRIHAFQRTQAGLYACINQKCSGRKGTKLDMPDWVYGAIYHEKIDRCKCCHSVVYELKMCTLCGREALAAARISQSDGTEVLANPATQVLDDEFVQELVDSDQEEGSEDDQLDTSADTSVNDVLLTVQNLNGGSKILIEPTTGQLLEGENKEAVLLHAHDAHMCPNCGATFSQKNAARLSSFRVGAPFFLGNVIPELLDDAQPRTSLSNGADGPENAPAGGKQLLTFTDSRQGTARLSAKLQTEAERNYIRAIIYHLVQHELTQVGRTSREAELIEQISKIEIALRNPEIPKAMLEPILANLNVELARASKPRAVSWRQLLDRISSDRTVKLYIKEKIWQQRDVQFLDHQFMAQFLLLREFFRRPRRANSIETMGLARLTASAIEEITETRIPRQFTEHGGTLADWKDFLSIILTRFVRANSAVLVAPELRHWIHRKIPTSVLVGPSGTLRDNSLQRMWPRQVTEGKAGPAFVRLLMQGLKIDIRDSAQRANVSDILAASWNALLPLMAASADGYALDFDKLEVASLDRGYFCPVTRRVLDRAFRGLSPYPAASGFLAAQKIDLPRLPFPFGRSEGIEIAADRIETWLREDEKVASGRKRGSWSNIHDRIVKFATFYRTAEHSAQQPSWLLREYEREFRQGNINVLNCSTTMEMGVDIGSIGSVVMTNVPPSLASYRQRVGRAGRRGQPMAVGYTICKDRPLDTAVFRDPPKLLQRAMRAPTVSLDSSVIVQRHVNALLLGRFLRERGQELLRLEAGIFFGCDDKTDGTLQDDCASCAFRNWLELSSTRSEVTSPVKALIEQTCLEGRVEQVLEAASEKMRVTEAAFRREWDALKYDINEKLDASAKKAIELQIKRLTGSYLLHELASKSFLPAYGFPTDVVTFDTTQQFNRKERNGANLGGALGQSFFTDDASRRFSARGLPSRSLDLAIRDYAPGTDVVIDGLVYRSAGVTLSWKRPIRETKIGEIQVLGHAWRCEVCGAVGTAHARPENCASCSADSSQLHVMSTLKPAGFTCDPFQKPHADIEHVDFVTPRLPWVAVNEGQWIALHDAAIGRFRATCNGSVLHYTLGAHGHGYAICLSCGRAEPEKEGEKDNPPLPEGVAIHTPLRGRHQQIGSSRCDGVGKPFAIRRHHALSYEVSTDVFELQLFDIPSQKEGLSIALPIGIALREGLARLWGIESGELGVAATLNRRTDGHAVWSIFVFDRAPGGAGFSPAAADAIELLLTEAITILDCPNGEACQSGCPDCILTRDVEMQMGHIDRIGALKFLRERVEPRLVIDQADQAFGPSTFVELRPIADAIVRETELRPSSALSIWLPEKYLNADISNWVAIDVVRRLTLKGRQVQFVVQGLPDSDDSEGRMALLSVLNRTGAKMLVTNEAVTPPGFVPLAYLVTDVGTKYWAIRKDDRTQENSLWVFDGTVPVLRRDDVQIKLKGKEVSLADLSTYANDEVTCIEVKTQLDGMIGGFGTRFWQIISEHSTVLERRVRENAPLRAIHYTDRYLFAPLSVRLVFEMLRDAPGLAKATLVELNTTGSSGRMNGSTPFKLYHDWNRDSDRHAVTRDLLSAKLGCKASVRFKDKMDLPHARTLDLHYDDGRIQIYLDQGVGYWRLKRDDRFDFTQGHTAQISQLLKCNADVIGEPTRPMPIWVREI